MFARRFITTTAATGRMQATFGRVSRQGVNVASVGAQRNYAGHVGGQDDTIGTPSFGAYKEPESSGFADSGAAKGFAYFLVGAGGWGYATAVKAGVTDFLSAMNPSADVLAMANVEVELGNIPEGQALTVKWRGKPLFIRHRTQAEIQAAEGDDGAADLRDPETDAVRRKKAEWLVVIGICTHLGCVPLNGAGEYNGWFCPCHGSHYDTSGRIRKGPAPLNLEVPPYQFLTEEKLLVGVEG
eukprot:TRINITY_DN8647_c0_g1_i1.p1 TRINITY_DN8647_c0_g1~~TRINITY_DN8647_c0_g1_i1.p1  ORF type:complete len:249 (-),score=45.69 TRINITY_DN8647_c0_g1_i1:146-868(-)